MVDGTMQMIRREIPPRILFQQETATRPRTISRYVLVTEQIEITVDVAARTFIQHSHLFFEGQTTVQKHLAPDVLIATKIPTKSNETYFFSLFSIELGRERSPQEVFYNIRRRFKRKGSPTRARERGFEREELVGR